MEPLLFKEKFVFLILKEYQLYPPGTMEKPFLLFFHP